MAFVRANPNQYLLVGRAGRLENRGSAVQAFLLPGSVFVLVPAMKQEASFEFTQETNDGIPLRFKGIVIYRITDPLAAARLFDLGGRHGVEQIAALITHVCLGELRDAVSHMSMVECIEQRKTTLSGVVERALEQTIHEGGEAGDWGITIEVAQVAQVFIVDPQLRQQLEAEVRNEIKLKSDQSNIRVLEEARLAEMASEGRVRAERVASEQEALQLEQARFRAEMTLEADRANAEAPVRLLKIAREREILAQDLEMRALRNQVKALEVEHDLLLARAQQDLRRQILPLEQAPAIVESASKVLYGTNLSIYGDDSGIVGQVAPVLGLLGRAIERATAATAGTAAAAD